MFVIVIFSLCFFNTTVSVFFFGIIVEAFFFGIVGAFFFDAMGFFFFDDVFSLGSELFGSFLGAYFLNLFVEGKEMSGWSFLLFVMS